MPQFDLNTAFKVREREDGLLERDSFDLSTARQISEVELPPANPRGMEIRAATPMDKVPEWILNTAQEANAQLQDLLAMPARLFGTPHPPMVSGLATKTIPEIATETVRAATTPIGEIRIPTISYADVSNLIKTGKLTTSEVGIEPAPLDVAFGLVIAGQAAGGIRYAKNATQYNRYVKNVIESANTRAAVAENLPAFEQALPAAQRAEFMRMPAEQRVEAIIKMAADNPNLGDTVSKLSSGMLRARVQPSVVPIDIEGTVLGDAIKSRNFMSSLVSEIGLAKETGSVAVFRKPNVGEMVNFKGRIGKINSISDGIADIAFVDEPGKTAVVSLTQLVSNVQPNQPPAGGLVHEIDPQTLAQIKKITPDISKGVNLTQDITVKDIFGNTKKYKKGESIFIYEDSKTGKAIVKDGDYGVLQGGQVDKVEQAGNAWGEFAPEMEGVEVIKKTETKDFPEEKVREFINNYREDTGERISREEAILAMRETEDQEGYSVFGRTKYSQYTLPGGENYREVLIKAPEISELVSHEYEARPFEGKWAIYEKGYEPPLASGYDTKQIAEHYINTAFAKETRETPGFKSSHWDEPNILAHLRLNDRTTPDGEKVLFIEEIQSDWAREARAENPIKDVMQEFGVSEAEAKEMIAGGEYKTRIPSHPLLKNWQELALKQALKQAVEGGYDAIAWTTGEQQAQRYDLSEQVDDVIIKPAANKTQGKYFVEAIRDGKSVIGRFAKDDKELEQIVGKDLAKKAIADKAYDKEQSYQGDDLKIGGEWAKNLYDKQIPSILKKLTGGEVKTINMGKSVQKGKGGIQGPELDIKSLDQQSLTITPEVRRAIMGEQPIGGGAPAKPPVGPPETAVSGAPMPEDDPVQEVLQGREIYPEILERITITDREYLKRYSEGKSINDISKELREGVDDTIRGLRFAAESYLDEYTKFEEEVSAAGEGDLSYVKSQIKEYLSGQLDPELKKEGEYKDIALIPWLWAKKGEGLRADGMASELANIIGDPNIQSEGDVIAKIEEYFSAEIYKKAAASVSAGEKKIAQKRARMVGKLSKIKELPRKRQETGVGQGTILNTPDDTDKSLQGKITQDMPFTLLGNKAEVLARMSQGLKDILRNGIKNVFDLWGGAKGYRIGLFNNVDAQNYHLNEFSDERSNYYRNMQDPEKVELIKARVKELRNDLIGRIAKGMGLEREKYPDEAIRVAVNKWMARGEADMRNKFVLGIIQDFGNEVMSAAVADKFKSPESSAAYYFLQNTSVYGISKEGDEYKWSQGILRNKTQIRDNMRRIEEVDRQLDMELKRDKGMTITQQDAWQVMDEVVAAINRGEINASETAVTVDPQYLNPSGEGGTYSVGQQDTTWEGHKKNLEKHFLPLVRTGVKIIYTNNVDPNLLKWLKQKNIPYNVEIGIGAGFGKGGRDEVIAVVNYEIPEVYSRKYVSGAVGTEPEIITGESPEYTAYKQEVEKQKIADDWKQAILEDIERVRETKKLSYTTVKKIKKYFDVREIKNADIPQLRKVQEYIKTLNPKDELLSEKQAEIMKRLLGDIKDLPILSKRIVIERFGDKEDILQGMLVDYVPNEWLPTVDITEGHPYIKQVVYKSRELMDRASNETDRRDSNLAKMLKAAEKSRKLPAGEAVSRFLAPQNKEIFMALSGTNVELTKEERAVVAYLKNFFAMVKRNLELEKYRRNYITHLEQPLTEKILTKGLFGAIRQVREEAQMKKGELPNDILLQMQDIVGSEKFFRFALERKGGIDPTTNLRKIVHEYGQLYETKKALDEILPEAQAVMMTLLKGQNALWMKRFLQNLKGRGLDFNLKTDKPKVGIALKVLDFLVNMGYIKMLGLNYVSAIKNIISGESNSFVWQTVGTYIKGKQRILTNPKRVYKIARENGILEGTYADYAQMGLSKLKELTRYAMIGQQIGEYEIRGSLMAGEMTDQEWRLGKLSPERRNEIKDKIARTQGVFSKIDSPLIVQTTAGRTMTQMSRWRITNAMMMRKIVNGAKEDWKNKDFNGKNSNRLKKVVMKYMIMAYLGYELANMGIENGEKFIKAAQEDINNMLEIWPSMLDWVKENPTISFIGEIIFSIQEIGSYMLGTTPPSKISFERGIEDTYISALETLEDLTE